MKDGVARSEWSGGQGLRRLGQSATATSTPSTSAEAKIDESSDVDELCDAQIRKLTHIIEKAKIQPGNRVLEIGSVRVPHVFGSKN